MEPHGGPKRLTNMAPSRLLAIAALAALAVAVIAALVIGGEESPANGVPVVSSADTSADHPDQSDAESDPAQSPADALLPVEAGAPLAAAPAVLRQRPGLVEVDGWLQSDYASLDDLDGEVFIVEFWTFGCFNCRNVKPHLRAIYDEYRSAGLEIVGIHSPEFDFEKDVPSIEEAAGEQNVNWPIVLDTNKRTFRIWQQERRFWPRTYVVDQNGDIRYDHIGEGGYDELEATVAWLLENGA